MRLTYLLRTIVSTLASLALIPLGLPGIAAGADAWPRFRGPLGDGVAVDVADVPLRWAPDQHVRWRTELPGLGWSSPVVDRGHIYVTTAVPRAEDTSDHDLVLLAVDALSGEVVQRTTIFTPLEDQSPRIHSKNSHASPTPLVAGNRIFVHFGHQGTAATDLDGKVLWTNRELKYPPVHGNGGSPQLVAGKIIFACDGAEDPFVAALDADDGTLAWRVDRPVDAENKFSFCTPMVIEVSGQFQVVVPGSDCVMALDPADGRTLWMVRYDGYSVVPQPVYADGLVLMSTGFGPTRVLAINPNLEGDITDTGVVWTLDRGAPETPSLLADDGLLYVLSDDGILTVLQTADGKQVYRQRLGGKYSASPVLAAGKVYLTSEEGKTTVIRAGRQFDLLAENDLAEQTLASPAVIDGAIILRTAEALYRIEE